MRHFYKLITLACLLSSSSAYALEVFFDPLYWRATETFDWVHNSNLDTANLNVSYSPITYSFEPGFKVGVNYEGNFDTKLYYTKYYTSTSDSVSGNLTSNFLAGRLSQSLPAFYYQTGQLSASINFNMLDWDLGKHFEVTDSLMLRPIIGLEGGVINQTFNTHFQNQTLGKSESEQQLNDFTGVGPKLGIESKLVFLTKNDYQYSLIANFATSYLWGHWNIKDTLHNNAASTISVNVQDRNLGALGIQGLVGVNLNYKNFAMKLGYEFSDWFNQFQVFSNETGTQNNDLVLQGLTLGFSYQF